VILSKHLNTCVGRHVLVNGHRVLRHFEGEKHLSRQRANKKQQQLNRFNNNVIDFQQYVPPKKTQVKIIPRNRAQENYFLKLQDPNKTMLFAIGPAGTGKTLLATQMAIKLLKEGEIDKIIVTRPAVSVDEQHGFLPGTLEKKMEPWTRPIFDVFSEYYYSKDIQNMLLEGVIEVSPLAYMRGRTFKNAFILADEMQNTTPNQMKMLLTRIGENSRMVVTGDLKQADRLEDNGLIEFIRLLNSHKDLKHVDIVNFGQKDIERHPAVKEILEIYGD
jgi:phosphate starvation-inducible protein PhoH and related proteins